MCGICGVWDSEENIEKELIDSMAEALNHRGPDDSGIFVDKNIGLGHKRLSIIDLSTGRQPIHNEDGTMWIVYNGEFYNFLEERAKLMEKGHNFYTNTDTEVVLHLYEEYGSECVNKMNGMFAFAIYDSNMKRLFLARDRLGIKPLVYFFDGRRFAFASEIKSLLKDLYIDKEIDLKAVNDFFRFGFIPAPNTIFRNIKKLPPARTLLLQQNKLYIKEYWDVDFSFKQKHNLEAELKNRLKESVKLRLVSDVPLGAFLSGGVDSSAVVGMMSRLIDNVRTFSIGFEDQDYNELEYAKKVAEIFNTNHKEFVLKPAKFDLFPRLVYYLDEPFADPSIIPTFMVSNIAARHVKVILTGDGGDELFAGYDRYQKGRIEGIYSKLPGIIRDPVTSVFRKNERINRILTLGNIQDDEYRFFETNSLFTAEERHRLLNNPIQNPISIFHKSNAASLLDKQLYADMKFLLPNQFLKKVDTASMANSLEARVPFLDHEFVEFAVSVPPNKKLNLLETKHILKKTVSSFVPKEVLYRKKQGFSVPVGEWFRGELKDKVYDLILGERTKSRNYFDFKYIEKLWNQHQTNKFNHEKKLFPLVAFELWNRIFVDEETPSIKNLNELI
ncbi:asparagine synthase (glutamine-hydrolyzing) [Candidatus Woesearchaeota archaeon]|nr:asparagine synthase (glutamine-hydrolyzing) [Candidatus Woesearchaeota archaeon]